MEYRATATDCGAASHRIVVRCSKEYLSGESLCPKGSNSLANFFLRRSLISLFFMLAFQQGAAQEEPPGATASDAMVPGDSFANFSGSLNEEIRSNLAYHIRAEDNCEEYSVVMTQHIVVEGDLLVDGQRRLMSGIISELWTVDQCGETVQHLITISPDGAGGSVVALSKVEE